METQEKWIRAIAESVKISTSFVHKTCKNLGPQTLEIPACKKTSYWEISRGTNAQNKATQNYTKRTKDENLSVAERANATFVFVTPRSRDWNQPSQAAWIQERQGGGWKEVRVIDGVQLSEWLREFPAIGKWLLQRIGLVKPLTGFQTPAEHWSNLAQMVGKDDPPLPPKIFLAGRENACQQLERLFRRETQQLILAIEVKTMRRILSLHFSSHWTKPRVVPIATSAYSSLIPMLGIPSPFWGSLTPLWQVRGLILQIRMSSYMLRHVHAVTELSCRLPALGRTGQKPSCE